MDRLTVIYIYHCVAATIAYVLNFLLIILIQRCTKRDMGKYNYLLLSFTIFNIAYPTIQLLAAPMAFVYGRSYVFVSTTSYIQNSTVCYLLIIVYCTFYCQSLLILMFQFVYRYLAICHTKTLRVLHSGRALFSVVVFYITVSALWGCVAHFAMKPTDTEVALLDASFQQRYGISLTNLPSLGASFEVFIHHDKAEINWRAYYGIAFLNTIMTATCAVIGYCGIKIYSELKIIKHNRNAVLIKRELFKALLVQTVIPLILQYLPCFVIYITAIFGLPIDLEFTSLLVALDPVFEPVCIMYFVKDYRNAISSFLGFHVSTRTRSISYKSHTLAADQK